MQQSASGHPEIVRIVAPNPGPMTLEGTNTYLHGSGPCAVIDPGPDDAGHREAILSAAAERGGIGVVLLTHSHGDHADGAAALADRASPRSRRRGPAPLSSSLAGTRSSPGCGRSRPPATLPTTSAC